MENLKSFATDAGIVLKHHDVILAEALDQLIGKDEPAADKLKRNFGVFIQQIERKAYELYLQYEHEYGKSVLKALVNAIHEEGASTPDAIGVRLGDHFKTLDSFYLSITQSRRARAGRVFEKIHKLLFRALSYPFDEQPVINGKPDFVMPSADHYNTNPLECVVFTAKRTLRERWRQVVTEGSRGIGVYLSTIDENVSENMLQEIVSNKIFLVVPNKIKEDNYAHASNVLTFRSFFEDHLDPKKAVWDRS